MGVAGWRDNVQAGRVLVIFPFHDLARIPAAWAFDLKIKGRDKMSCQKESNINMWSLFDEAIEFPQNIAEKGVPENTLYEYVSSSLLNGYINHVNPIMAVMVARYGDENEIASYDANVKEFSAEPHCDLSLLRDDVLIAAESDNFYWFFWYDKDCSDCLIGRFSKAKCSKFDFIKSFEAMISDNECFKEEKTWKLNLTGWIKG